MHFNYFLLHLKLYSSISGFFGGSDAKDPSSSQVAHDDIIITPPPFPDKSNPHYKPGTTNNGGMLNKVQYELFINYYANFILIFASALISYESKIINRLLLLCRASHQEFSER